MGYLVNGTCYPDALTARDAFNSQVARYWGTSQASGEIHAHADTTLNVHLYPVTGSPPPHTYTGHNLIECTDGVTHPSVSSSTFNPSNINPSDVVDSMGHGFILVAVPLAVVWAGRHFLRPLFYK